MAINEILPTLQESDEQGVVFENSSVQVAQCLQRVHKLLLEEGMEPDTRVVRNGRAGCSGVDRNGGH
ncbi:MAG: hypothetical protein R2860_04705 [Desulfobacterales bacterium]